MGCRSACEAKFLRESGVSLRVEVTAGRDTAQRGVRKVRRTARGSIEAIVRFFQDSDGKGGSFEEFVRKFAHKNGWKSPNDAIQIASIVGNNSTQRPIQAVLVPALAHRQDSPQLRL
jgi:hypothetical protein